MLLLDRAAIHDRRPGQAEAGAHRGHQAWTDPAQLGNDDHAQCLLAATGQTREDTRLALAALLTPSGQSAEETPLRSRPGIVPGGFTLTGAAPMECVIGTGRVIKGWDQGLMGMQVGGKRKLQVPAHLGYGERSVGSIPPNSNLTFEIELLEVLTRDD